MNTQSFTAHVSEDRRLVILRLLAELANYTGNSAILRMALQNFGHEVSRDLVKTELRWLEEQGLLTIEAADSVLVAKLTERGQDVAAGISTTPGVKRPGA